MGDSSANRSFPQMGSGRSRRSSASPSVEELDEYIRKSDAQIVVKLRRVANKYRSKAETEYQALEANRPLRRRLKRLLRGWREGCRALRAKALRVKDENGGFRVVVENGLLVDVYGLHRDAGKEPD
jgi:hypothetical protein